ncbi:MAG: hypothetical protein QXE31_04080 [Candidatus Woesearchaeota archaeon]
MLKQIKQIYVKSLKENKSLLSMYEEAHKYLETLGFDKILLLSITDSDETFRSFLFKNGEEKIIVEYKKDMYEEILKLVFSTHITFIYDILLMRFNQISSEERESVFIYNE